MAREIDISLAEGEGVRLNVYGTRSKKIIVIECEDNGKLTVEQSK